MVMVWSALGPVRPCTPRHPGVPKDHAALSGLSEEPVDWHFMPLSRSELPSSAANAWQSHASTTPRSTNKKRPCYGPQLATDRLDVEREVACSGTMPLGIHPGSAVPSQEHRGYDQWLPSQRHTPKRHDAFLGPHSKQFSIWRKCDWDYHAAGVIRVGPTQDSCQCS